MVACRSCPPATVSHHMAHHMAHHMHSHHRYILRRCKEEFRSTPSADPISSYVHGKQQLDVVRRQSLVYGLYGRKIKNVLVRAFRRSRVLMTVQLAVCMASVVARV